ncbi:uncharacterized protein WCC33_014965 [Rhinophrynus dorsalis]
MGSDVSDDFRRNGEFVRNYKIRNWNNCRGKSVGHNISVEDEPATERVSYSISQAVSLGKLECNELYSQKRQYISDTHQIIYQEMCQEDNENSQDSAVGKQEAQDRPYRCVCGKSYMNSSHLYRHQRTHLQETLPPNAAYEDNFVTESRRDPRTMREKSFICVCGRSFTSTSHLYRHLRTHVKHAMEVAEENGEGTVKESERRERRIKPYACVCGKSYTSSSHLYRHQRTHLGENCNSVQKYGFDGGEEAQTEKGKKKHFICHCGRSYTSSSHLYRHQRTHTDEKIVVGEEKEDRGSKDNETQQKEKPYVCACGKSYTSSSHLYRHQRNHVGENLDLKG